MEQKTTQMLFIKKVLEERKEGGDYIYYLKN